MTPWFSDPDPGVQGLGSGAITRSADKLAYDAPDGIHLITMTGWPICTSATDQLIILGASEPYFGAADAGPATPGPMPAPGPGPRPGPISAQCTVPRLHGLSLAAARRRLLRAGCRLGHVRTGRSARNKYRGLVIISQQPAAGGTHPHNTNVNVSLGRPARTRHRH